MRISDGVQTCALPIFEPIERLAIGRPMRIAPVSLVKRSHVTAAPRILQAAEDCFGEHGIDAVSLRQIAIAAGQGNTAAVHYHFGSKEGLLERILQRSEARRVGEECVSTGKFWWSAA